MEGNGQCLSEANGKKRGKRSVFAPVGGEETCRRRAKTSVSAVFLEVQMFLKRSHQNPTKYDVLRTFCGRLRSLLSVEERRVVLLIQDIVGY